MLFFLGSKIVVPLTLKQIVSLLKLCEGISRPKLSEITWISFVPGILIEVYWNVSIETAAYMLYWFLGMLILHQIYTICIDVVTSSTTAIFINCNIGNASATILWTSAEIWNLWKFVDWYFKKQWLSHRDQKQAIGDKRVYSISCRQNLKLFLYFLWYQIYDLN